MELHFQTFAPTKALQPFVVQYLYMLKNFEVENIIPIVPTGLPALLIFLGPGKEGHIRYYQPLQKTINYNQFYLCGQTTQSYWLKLHGECQVFIVVLHPTALTKISGFSAADLTNTIVPLPNLEIKTDETIDQLLHSKSLLLQLPVLDAFLWKLFKKQNSIFEPVDGALDLILGRQGQVSINEIQKRERVSARTLHRKFTEQVGVSPKVYLRLIRFRSMMQFLVTHPKVSWLDLTCQFGYYDQSHLIKDFYLYTGQSPQKFLLTDQKIDNAILKVL